MLALLGWHFFVCSSHWCNCTQKWNEMRRVLDCGADTYRNGIDMLMVRTTCMDLCNSRMGAIFVKRTQGQKGGSKIFCMQGVGKEGIWFEFPVSWIQVNIFHPCHTLTTMLDRMCKDEVETVTTKSMAVCINPRYWPDGGEALGALLIKLLCSLLYLLKLLG